MLASRTVQYHTWPFGSPIRQHYKLHDFIQQLHIFLHSQRPRLSYGDTTDAWRHCNSGCSFGYNFGCSLVRTLGMVAAIGKAELEKSHSHDCLYSFVIALQKKIKNILFMRNSPGRCPGHVDWPLNVHSCVHVKLPVLFSDALCSSVVFQCTLSDTSGQSLYMFHVCVCLGFWCSKI